MENNIDQVVRDMERLKHAVIDLNRIRRNEENLISLEDVGAYIRFVRKERNITQYDMALALGINKSVLSAIESGRTNVKLDNFIKVTKAFGIEICLRERT